MQGESQCWRHCVYCHCTTRVDIAWRDVILCAINPHGPAEGVARMAGQTGHQAGQRFIIQPSWADVRGTFARCTSSPSRQDGKPGVQLLFLSCAQELRLCSADGLSESGLRQTLQSMGSGPVACSAFSDLHLAAVFDHPPSGCKVDLGKDQTAPYSNKLACSGFQGLPDVLVSCQPCLHGLLESRLNSFRSTCSRNS